jgi:type II secretion system protein I
LSRRPAEAGFTLIEALVALAVLGIAIVTALEASSQILRSQAAALREREAIALAEAKLNELSAAPRDSVYAWLPERAGRITLAGRDYTWHTRLGREPGTRALWRAAVRVEWRAGEYQLETLLRRREWPALAVRAVAP